MRKLDSRLDELCEDGRISLGCQIDRLVRQMPERFDVRPLVGCCGRPARDSEG